MKVGTSGEEVIATSGGTILAGVNITPDTHPDVPNAADDEFEYSTGLDTTGARRAGATAWTWFDQGSATFAVAQGQALLSLPQESPFHLRGPLQSAPTAPWRYRLNRRAFASPGSTNSQYCGFFLRNSANNKILTFNEQFSSQYKLSAITWADAVTFNATIQDTAIFNNQVDGAYLPFYFEIENDGTNIIGRYSFSGVDGTFIQFFSQAIATYMGAVDQIGIITLNNSGHPAWSAYDWFRRVA